MTWSVPARLLALFFVFAMGCVFDRGGVDPAQGDAGWGSDAAADASNVPVDTNVPGDTGLDAPHPPDGAVPDAVPFQEVGPLHNPPWWNPTYAYRVQLTVDETAAGSLPAGYSVVLKGFNTQGLVSAGKMQASGDDLRVVFWNGSANVELDRRLVAMDSTTTRIWLKTQTPISVTSAEYLLYYGNPATGAPPAYWSDSMGADTPSRVYLAADDFQEHSQGDCPDGWGSCGTAWLVEASGSSRYFVTQTSTNGQYLFAGDTTWTDVAVEARVRSDDPGGCPGVATRVEDTQNLVYAGYNCGSSSLPANNVAVWPRVNGSYSTLLYGAIAAPTGWHTIRLTWKSREVSLYHDDAFIGKANAPTAVDLAGNVGLFSTYGTKLYADDYIVRLFVDPEPMVSAGSEQPYLP